MEDYGWTPETVRVEVALKSRGTTRASGSNTDSIQGGRANRLDIDLDQPLLPSEFDAVEILVVEQ